MTSVTVVLLVIIFSVANIGLGISAAGFFGIGPLRGSLLVRFLSDPVVSPPVFVARLRPAHASAAALDAPSPEATDATPADAEAADAAAADTPPTTDASSAATSAAETPTSAVSASGDNEQEATDDTPPRPKVDVEADDTVTASASDIEEDDLSDPIDD